MLFEPRLPLDVYLVEIFDSGLEIGNRFAHGVENQLKLLAVRRRHFRARVLEQLQRKRLELRLELFAQLQLALLALFELGGQIRDFAAGDSQIFFGGDFFVEIRRDFRDALGEHLNLPIRRGKPALCLPLFGVELRALG